MMDFELRLAALSKLMGNKSEAVEHRLSEEFRRIEDLLRQGMDYDELVAALKTLAVLGPRFHGAVVPLLTDFVHSVRTRALTQGGELIPGSRLRYRSPAHLVREAIDATTPVRYLHTEAFVDFLLELSQDGDDEVRGKAERALEALAEFDLDIFYGARGLGAKPQADIVAHLASLDDAQLVANADVMLRILRKVLSPSMKGHSWTYSSVTISSGAIVSSGGVLEMRAAAIALAKRLYPLGDVVAYRKSVLRTLGAATHRERPAVDAATAVMFERDAIEVLHFLRNLVPNEALPLVQSIEHDGYWNYHHAASEPIRAAALEIRAAVAKHAEYQIYKQLIGFEGIFGDWEQLRGSEAAWDYTNAKRQEAARQFVGEINDDSYEEWRNRILKFSETESDDLASFPVYYEFLELLGQKKPHLALQLVTAHEKHMDRFLIPLVSGLWSSDRQADIETIVQCWIAEGVHLTVAAKSLFKDGAKQLEILQAVVKRSAQLGYLNALVSAMGVAASLHAQGCAPAKAVFMLALRELAKHDDASWSSAVWFSRDFRSLVATMDAAERAEVLGSMATLPKLNYQAEEVLSAVGEQDIQALLDYLAGRLKEERLRDARERAADDSPFNDDAFEAIPHHLHKLNHLLAKVPEAVLSILRRDFEEEERSMFQYRSGARLMQAVFPGFNEPLQTLLRKLVQDGLQHDIDFVLAVIRAYGGAPILEVCKAIIKVVPEMSPAWNELAAAMESTGVVTGEYGFVHAFERKRDEIVPWKNDDNARVRAFADWLTDILERQIVQEQKRADESLALRKYKYGVGKDLG